MIIMSLIEIENKIKEKALLTQEEIEYFLTCICQIATNYSKSSYL